MPSVADFASSRMRRALAWILCACVALTAAPAVFAHSHRDVEREHAHGHAHDAGDHRDVHPGPDRGGGTAGEAEPARSDDEAIDGDLHFHAAGAQPAQPPAAAGIIVVRHAAGDLPGAPPGLPPSARGGRLDRPPIA